MGRAVTTWSFTVTEEAVPGQWRLEAKSDTGHSFVLHGRDPKALLADARRRARDEPAD